MVCYNTAESTKAALSKFSAERNYDILVINDGSTDETRDIVTRYNFKSIEHSQNRGVGAAIKTGIRYAVENNYEIAAVLAGNNKDNPAEISRLFDPIIKEGYDYVQGSRFIHGGRWDNLPPFRFIMVKIHAFLFSLLTGKRCTDALNGFRAYRLSIFNDKRINIWQDWLDKYEFETYLHYKVLKYGYRFKEVPVSKIYPENWREVHYTHIRPIIDWWSILRPLFLITTGIKK
jgi:dolichol-phosphate mannosyltransferase